LEKNEKKIKNRKVEKKKKKKRKKWGKLATKKKGGRITVDYCCNPH
jgi:hypothetical protein